MSAAYLRETAALMRKRAEAVPAEGLSDWWFGVEASDLMHLRLHDREQIAYFAHPAVALAVADWLDACALVCEVKADAAKTNAMTVARAYRGDAS